MDGDSDFDTTVGLDLSSGKSAEEPNRIGGWLGAIAQSNDEPPKQTPIDRDLKTAPHLGRRVAETSQRMQPT